MLAKRVPTILPPLTLEEALETTKIHSIAGVLPAHMREIAVDRAMAAPGGSLALEDLKIIVLMVFWSMGEEPDALILDELFVDDADRLIH